MEIGRSQGGHLRRVSGTSSSPMGLGWVMPPESVAVPPRPFAQVRIKIGHVFRGALIGLVELVPGVSGGTVALILGLYERLIESASILVHAVVMSARRRTRVRARASFRRVEWPMVLPLCLGMFMALFALSGPLHHLVEAQPILTRSLFLGMVTASLLVPASMVRGTVWGSAPRLATEAVLVLGIAGVVFLLLGLPAPSREDPTWWVIALSGAVAVCALALPGLSGSFILLTLGMYEPTLAAVGDRDFAYLAVFVLGAAAGVGTFVRFLAYLLTVHRRATLLASIGLILGSLRALWPWQMDGALLPPEPGAWGWPLAAWVCGAALVLALWLRERPEA
jgi:putative membrane protein